MQLRLLKSLEISCLCQIIDLTSGLYWGTMSEAKPRTLFTNKVPNLGNKKTNVSLKINVYMTELNINKCEIGCGTHCFQQSEASPIGKLGANLF